MERVVYLLGAGFSAPLGLPVMANFLTRSRELADNEPERYGFFNDIFKTIRDMAFAKNFYNADLFNIEEILSILDMQDTVAGTDHAKHFAGYIKAVIEACTPEFEPPSFPTEGDGRPMIDDGFANHVFGPVGAPESGYCHFIPNLVNLRMDVTPDRAAGRPAKRLVYSGIDSPVALYDVVTLNYDRVVEGCIDYIGTQYKQDVSRSASPIRRPRVAKPHGSVDTAIVPPTWRKLAVDGLKDQWRLAHDILRQATQIRILGYSLPPTDTYLRYLLEAAAIHAERLKRIDVICLDDKEGSVRRRYEGLVSFRFFRFANEDIADYLDAGSVTDFSIRKRGSSGGEKMIRREFSTLEEHHEHFMADADE